jgi:hypothetical protein
MLHVQHAEAIVLPNLVRGNIWLHRPHAQASAGFTAAIMRPPSDQADAGAVAIPFALLLAPVLLLLLAPVFLTGFAFFAFATFALMP